MNVKLHKTAIFKYNCIQFAINYIKRSKHNGMDNYANVKSSRCTPRYLLRRPQNRIERLPVNYECAHLKHVCVRVLLVFDDHRMIARQCIRYGVLVGVQNGFGGGWRLYDVVLGAFHAARLGAFVQDEFGAPPAAIALRQEAIVTEQMRTDQEY